jgi:hypothetical protein
MTLEHIKSFGKLEVNELQFYAVARQATRYKKHAGSRELGEMS